MNKETDTSPINELAKAADEALELCWERLEQRKTDFTDIELMIQAWRDKQKAWQIKEDHK